MKIAYLTTMYPAVSHTFIRREILALESLGHEVVRFAVRSPQVCVDAEDQAELAKTSYLLESSLIFMLVSLLQEVLRAPSGFFKALVQVIKMHFRSERGLVAHLAYLVEACVLVRLMRKAGVDRVHVHFGTNATAVALLAKFLAGIRYSFTVHGPDEFDAPIGLSLRDKIENSEFVAGISKFCVSQLKRWVSYEHWEKLKIVHCSVDASFLSASHKHTPSQQLVCVGRLSAQKGHFVLLNAFSKFIKMHPQAKLVLAGDGEMRDVLEQFIHDQGLSESVEITGWIDGATVREYISNSKALVLPSFAEGLPVVIMEAFAMMKPVISTYIAGIPELVVNEKNGFLVTPNDEQQLIQALSDLFDLSEHELFAMGAHGRESVLTNHNSLSEAVRLESLFKDYS